MSSSNSCQRRMLWILFIVIALYVRRSHSYSQQQIKLYEKYADWDTIADLSILNKDEEHESKESEEEDEKFIDIDLDDSNELEITNKVNFKNSYHYDGLPSIFNEDELLHHPKEVAPKEKTDNSTIYVLKKIRKPELSQTAMDIITIVWYVATFLALAAFFLLMACSEKRCNDIGPGMQNNNANTNVETAPQPPPTPSPSYSEFAPPAYSDLEKEGKINIFVIPMKEDNQNVTTTQTNSNTHTGNRTPTAPPMEIYTVNELQKLSTT